MILYEVLCLDSTLLAETLTDEWTVPNDALDVFFVLTYAGNTNGLSRTDGSCDKNAKGMDGSVVAIDGDTSKQPLVTGHTLAHEIGHYLGLDQDFDGNHSPDPNNLMYFQVPNGGQLTGGQGGVMKLHCRMREACQA